MFGIFILYLQVIPNGKCIQNLNLLTLTLMVSSITAACGSSTTSTIGNPGEFSGIKEVARDNLYIFIIIIQSLRMKLRPFNPYYEIEELEGSWDEYQKHGANRTSPYLLD